MNAKSEAKSVKFWNKLKKDALTRIFESASEEMDSVGEQIGGVNETPFMCLEYDKKRKKIFLCLVLGDPRGNENSIIGERHYRYDLNKLFRDFEVDWGNSEEQYDEVEKTIRKYANSLRKIASDLERSVGSLK